MKLAIVDNDKIIINKIEKLVYEAFRDSVIDVYVNNYEDVYQVEYDIVIFDICLGKISGIDLAIKYSTLYEKSLIVFVSNYDDFVYDVFDINTFIFIRKRFLKEEFQRLINKYYRFMDRTSIVIKYKNEIFNIIVNDIVFIEVFRNTSYIHTKNNTYKCNLSLQKVESEINKDYFYRINRYTILNLNYVKDIKGKNVHLINGRAFHIPRGKLVSFKMIYVQHLASIQF